MKPWVVFYRYVYKLLLHIFMKKKRNMVTHFFIICSFNVHLKYSSLHFPGFMHENCLNSNHRGTRERKMEEYFEIGKKYLKHKKDESEKMQAKLCICKAANVKPNKSTYKTRRQMQKVADDNEEGGCPATLSAPDLPFQHGGQCYHPMWGRGGGYRNEEGALL